MEMIDREPLQDKHYMVQRIPKQFLESVSEPDKAIAYCIERMHRELADKLLDEVDEKGTCVCSLLPVEKKEVFDMGYSIEFKQGISVMELVRCGECKHALYESTSGRSVICNYCTAGMLHERDKNWFCADGERMETSAQP